MDSRLSAARIEAIRSSGDKEHVKIKLVVDEVLRNVNLHAEIYHDQPAPGCMPRCYIRDRETGQISDIFEGPALNDLITGFGLHLRSTYLKTCADHLAQHIRLDGVEVKVCAGHHYDADAHVLYLAVDPLRVLRISSQTVEYVGNVIDGLLFLHAGDPVCIDLETVRNCKLGMRVESDSVMGRYFEATYSTAKQSAQFSRQLLCTRVLALFFPDLFDCRPLLILDGEPGGGKTVLAKKIGWMMCGSAFEVSVLSEKKDDVETLLTSDNLVCLDNLDSPVLVRKYNSLICQCVTGGSVARRTLFTTNIKASYPLKSTLICTSIDLGWVRETVGDRSLIIEIAPRPKNGKATSSHNIKDEAMRARPALMQEVVGRCRNILIALEAQAAYESPLILRMHDFSSFMMKCAVREGWPGDGLAILKNVFGSQRTAAASNNPLLDVIRFYIGNRDEAWLTQPLSPTTLAKRFREAADMARIDAGFEWGKFGMNGTIAKQFSTLQETFGMQRKTNTHTKSWEYFFAPTSTTMQECRAFAEEINGASIGRNKAAAADRPDPFVEEPPFDCGHYAPPDCMDPREDEPPFDWRDNVPPIGEPPEFPEDEA